MEEKSCFFNIPRISKKESAERTSESSVSLQCDGDLSCFNELFDMKSNYDEKTIADIIFARGAAEFEVTKDIFGKLFICQSHRNQLYFKWDLQKGNHILFERKSSNDPRKPVCSFPPSYGPDHKLRRPFTSGCVVSFEDAKNFLSEKKLLVHVGLPICNEHKNFLKSINESYSTEKSSSDTSPPSSQVISYKSHETRKTLQKPESTISDEISEAIKNFAKKAGVTRIAPNEKFSNLTEYTKRRKASILKKLIHLIAQFMAPDNPELLLNEVLKSTKTESKVSKQVDNLLNRISKQYYAAANDRERNEVLSQVANSFPFQTILIYLPNLTPNRYTRARKTAALRTIMWNMPSTIKIKVRYSKEIIYRFIDFLTSPLVTVGLPFGWQTVKYSSGEKVEIPNTIRKYTANEIWLMFNFYMNEIGVDAKISRSTVFKLVKICKQSKRVALQCVDYYVAEACEAFEMLHSMLDNLLKNDLVDELWKKETKNLLQQSEHYLKTDYRIHIKLFSRCADHCITYALSDPDNKKFSSPKCQEIEGHSHEHDFKCDRCLYFPEAIRRIQNIIDESFSNITENDELSGKLLEFKEIVEHCEKKIVNLKMHILRSVFSDMESSFMIENLKEGEAFATLDFAQKIIPRKSNQPQSEYYAQKGLSMHMIHIFAIINGKLEQHSVAHLLGFEKQSAKTTITINRDFLSKLKSWGIKVVSFRSDNASNYHNIDLMVNLFAMSLDIGIQVERYSFSEVQNGKAWADMETSRFKRKMKSALDAGKNIETPEAMYEAIQFGTQPLSAATVVIATVTGKDCDSKKPLKGITKMSDFIFDYENMQIRYWKHYKIGNGETIEMKDYKTLVLNAKLNISRETSTTPNTENFWRSSTVAAIEKENESTVNEREPFDENVEIDPENDYINPTSTEIFFCPVDGCQKSFKTCGYLERHVRIGKHLFVPERCTVQDYALNTYRQCIESATATNILPELPELLESLAETEEIILKKGWALRERASKTLYSNDMKAFLDKEFESSQQKNQRINPKIVQEKMAESRKENNRLRFKVVERLSSIQIGKYFAAKLKKLREGESEEEEEDEDNLLQDEIMFSDKFEAFLEELDWSKLIPKGKEEGEHDETEEEIETPKKKTPKKNTEKTPKTTNKQKTPTSNENQPPPATSSTHSRSSRRSPTSSTAVPQSSTKRPRASSTSPQTSEFGKSKKAKK